MRPFDLTLGPINLYKKWKKKHAMIEALDNWQKWDEILNKNKMWNKYEIWNCEYSSRS